MARNSSTGRTTSAVPSLLKCERAFHSKTLAGHRWTPVAFHVSNDAFQASEMLSRISMKGIRQIPTEHHVSSYVYHLPDSEGPAQNAAICVDTHQDHILNVPLFEQI